MNKISVQQLFEIRQKATGNNIISGETGTGKNFLVKREIAYILENTDDKVIVLTDSHDYEEYQDRVLIMRSNEFMSLFDCFAETDRKVHIYIFSKYFPEKDISDLLAGAGETSWDVTVVCNGNIKQYSDKRTCVTVLNAPQMSAETGKIVAKKAGFRNSDYISEYINIFVTDGSIYEINF